MKLIWSFRAMNNLQNIADHIANDNPGAARGHVQKIVKKVRQVKRFPKSGRVVPEVVNQSIREVIEGNYRIVYILEENKKIITVVTVFESHKQLRI